MTTQIVLASSSVYRRELLARLHLDFETQSPDIDETRLADETARAYVQRLAEAKARRVARDFPAAVVIGSDQCAVLEGEILGKPGNHENALHQLQQAQGRTVEFHTGLCVLCEARGFVELDDVVFEVDFRSLEDRQLERYLHAEQPYDCAGSFRSEGYGISLFRRMRGDDPTALIGLPLIRLIAMLEAAGIEIL